MIKLEKEHKREERESWVSWDVSGLQVMEWLALDNKVRTDGKQAVEKSK